MKTGVGGRKLALGAIAGVLGVALLGGAALAAFAPASDALTSEVPGDVAGVAADRDREKLKTILDGLVTKGVITQAQEDAILAAVREAAPKRDGDAVKRIFGDLMDASARYLGLTIAELRVKLPGTSLAAIADSTPGKSKAGLVAALQTHVNAAIDAALAAGKITREQADKAKAEAPAHITRFVEHVYEQRAPKPLARALTVARFIGDGFAAAQDYLGLTKAQLATSLREGKSLGEIANATPGKTRDGLIAHLTTAGTAAIDAAQAAGKITAEQAATFKPQVGQAVTALVDGKAGAPRVKR